MFKLWSRHVKPGVCSSLTCAPLLQQRILSEHERKLQEEEFADQRKEDARSAFRNRFKKIADDSSA